jgi:hypothetical protein
MGLLRPPFSVIPAQAEIQTKSVQLSWIPAFAGMTRN